MTKKIKAVLRGMGSVLDLAPSPSASRFIPQGSDTERLRADFERIGADMCQAFTTSAPHGQKSHRSQAAP